MSEPEHASPTALRTLAVFAHPDDETLAGGHLIAQMAHRGPVTVVTATRGERGEVIVPELAHLEGAYTELGRVREQEIAGAVAALGVQHHVFLDQLPGLSNRRPANYTDSGMQWPPGETAVRAIPADDVAPDAFSTSDLDIAARLLAALIRTERPALVLTDEPDGGYGHPDHVRSHQVTMRAVELAAQGDLTSIDVDDVAPTLEPWRVPVVAWVVRPGEAMKAGRQWLADRRDRPTNSTATGTALVVPGEDGALPTIARPAEQVSLSVPASPQVLSAVARAMSSHRTQIQEVAVDPDYVADSGGVAAGWFALSNDVLQPVPAQITALVAPGWGSAEQLRGLVTGEVVNLEHGGAGEAADGVNAAHDEDDADPRWYRVLMLVLAGVIAIVVALVSTVFHRWNVPLGLGISYLAVVAGAMLARSLEVRRGHILYAALVCVVVVAMTYAQSTDVIVTGEPIGVAWLIGAPVLAFAGVFAPRRWFRD